MRRKLVAGNWKMHGSLAGNRDLLRALVRVLGVGGGAECAVCVPFPYLAQTQAELDGSAIAWGAQNVSEHAHGAFTGEVSAAMLTEFGCRYVLVGHSERRSLYDEDDATVAAKFVAAAKAGLTPILCLGETLEQRERGVTERIVIGQFEAVLRVARAATFANAVIAYEPVWAIGTGRTATKDQAQEVHALLRSRVAAEDRDLAGTLRIVYGGSVKAQNAAELFAMPDIDGGLVGGASLMAHEFLEICDAAGL